MGKQSKRNYRPRNITFKRKNGENIVGGVTSLFKSNRVAPSPGATQTSSKTNPPETKVVPQSFLPHAPKYSSFTNMMHPKAVASQKSEIEKNYNNTVNSAINSAIANQSEIRIPLDRPVTLLIGNTRLQLNNGMVVEPTTTALTPQ